MIDMRQYTVYALVDPRNDLPKYVGITTRNPSVRLNEHRCHAAKRIPALGAWLQTLASLGFIPAIRLLEQNPADGLDAEIRWIRAYRESGHDLFNKADGGRGSKGVHHSEAWKKQNSIRTLGLRRSAATRGRISASKIGKARPDLGARNRQSARLSDEQVADIRNRLASGITGTAIASEFGISTAMVSLIKQNKRRS